MLEYLTWLIPYAALLIGSCSLVESIRNRRSLRRFRTCDKSKCASMVEQAIVRRESKAPVDPMLAARRELTAMPSKDRAELRRIVEEVALVSEGRILDKLRAESTDWNELTQIDIKRSEGVG